MPSSTSRRSVPAEGSLPSAVGAGDPIKCRGNPSQQCAEIRQVDQREQQAGDPEDVWVNMASKASTHTI